MVVLNIICLDGCKPSDGKGELVLWMNHNILLKIKSRMAEPGDKGMGLLLATE